MGRILNISFVLRKIDSPAFKLIPLPQRAVPNYATDAAWINRVYSTEGFGGVSIFLWAIITYYVLYRVCLLYTSRCV